MRSEARVARASLIRADFQNGVIFDRFYERFLETSDLVPPYFKDTDFTRQREVLRNGVLMTILYAEGDRLGQPGIDWIRETHARGALDVKPDLYPLWLDTWLQTVEEFDPDFDEAIAAAWRKVIQHAIDHIVDGYSGR